MNYVAIYNRLITRAQQRTLSADTYVERHHIVPSCIGGSDDPTNLVKLTAEEHYVAHQLLVKMYPDNKHLVCAIAFMAKGAGNRKRAGNRKIYGWLRRRILDYRKSPEFRETMSKAMKGKPNLYLKGRPKTTETKKKLSLAKKGKPILALRGKPKSPEHRKIIGDNIRAYWAAKRASAAATSGETV
jgi:hypothetical protein